MFQGHAQAARRPEDADGPGHVQPAGQRSVEVENKSPAHVPLNPLIEDLDQETAPLVRPDGSVRDLVAFLEAGLPFSLIRSTMGMNWM